MALDAITPYRTELRMGGNQLTVYPVVTIFRTGEITLSAGLFEKVWDLFLVTGVEWGYKREDGDMFVSWSRGWSMMLYISVTITMEMTPCTITTVI